MSPVGSRIAGIGREIRQSGIPCFALVDAARAPSACEFIVHADGARVSLYKGPSAKTLATIAPYAIDFSKNSALLQRFLREGWGNAWGVCLQSKTTLSQLRNHFRRFLVVDSPDNRLFYFRFYDPRVLRVFLPACSREELTEFFGPVESFLMEGKEPSQLMRYTLEKGALQEQVVRV